MLRTVPSQREGKMDSDAETVGAGNAFLEEEEEGGTRRQEGF